MGVCDRSRHRSSQGCAQQRLLLFGALVPLLVVGVESSALGQTFPPVVYASRQFERLPLPQERHTAIERASDGRLMRLEPDGSSRPLIDAGSATVPLPIDVSDPAPSYDAERIIFAGYAAAERAWRIFEARADGTGLRQITHSDRALDLTRFGDAAEFFVDYDDTDPCYLPDGRICFVSTRYPGIAPAGRLRTTNIYVVNADGRGLRRVTTERFGGDTPAVDPVTGKIVYSRWWLTVPAELPTPRALPVATPSGPPRYYGPPPSPPTADFTTTIGGIAGEDFEGVNSWFLATTNPDGTAHAMFTGFGLNRDLTMAWRPSFTPQGEVAALFLVAPPFLGYPGEHGLRVTTRGAALPRALGGPQSFDGSAVMPDPNPALRTELRVAPEFVYQSAEALTERSFLVTGYRPGVDERPGEAPGYGIFVQQEGYPPAPLHAEEGRLALDAVPLLTRPQPPVIADSAPVPASDAIPATVAEAMARNGSFHFVVENIFANAAIDVPIATAPPLSRDLRIEFYMQPQRDGAESPRAPILVTTRNVPLSGRVEVELPAEVPLFEVLRLPDSRIAMGRDGQVFHVGGMNFGVAGTVARCVGCHAGHSQMPLPRNPGLMNLAPSAAVAASSVATEIGGRAVSGGSLAPASLVDRKRDMFSSDWAAARHDTEPWVSLTWPQPVAASKVVLYGIQPGPGVLGPRDLRIKRFWVETFLGALPVERIYLQNPIAYSGTLALLNPTRSFDRLVVSMRILDVEGQYEGDRHTALSEIEVIGTIANSGPGSSRRFFVRGDADCNRRFTVNDPIAVLSQLYGGAPPCCAAASDVNGDDALDWSDVSQLLGWLFDGGPQPAAPFPDCAPVTVDALSCAEETCPGDR